MTANSSILFAPRPGWLSDYAQSLLRPPDIELGKVQRILQDDYALGLIAPPRNLPNARRNRNLILETTRGRKVFKLYRADWRPQTIEFEHSILRQLHHLGVRAPQPVKTVHDDTWVERAKARYALFEFIEGRNYSSAFLFRAHRLRLNTLLGVVLASLHKGLAGFQPQGKHHLGFADYEGPRHRDLHWHELKLNELNARSKELADAEDRQEATSLIAQSDFILQELAELDERLNWYMLPRLVIHGDYGLHNLVVQSLDRATAVDFELARIEWRLSDLASCLSKLRYSDGSYDFESMRWFMHGYRQVWPIPEEEWSHFPDVLRYYRLMGTVQYWNSFFETGGPTRKLLSAKDALEQSTWGVNNRRRVLELNAV